MRRENGGGEREAGAARFYSGSDEARKRNKEKMYTRSRRTGEEIEEAEEAEEAAANVEGRGREIGRVGEKVPRNYYTLDHRHSRDDPGAIIFPKLRPSTSNSIFLFFFSSLFPFLLSPLILSLFLRASPTFTIVTIVRLTSDG